MQSSGLAPICRRVHTLAAWLCRLPRPSPLPKLRLCACAALHPLEKTGKWETDWHAREDMPEASIELAS